MRDRLSFTIGGDAIGRIRFAGAIRWGVLPCGGANAIRPYGWIRPYGGMRFALMHRGLL